MRKLFQDQKLVVKMMGGLVAAGVIALAAGWVRASQVQAEGAGIENTYQRHVEDICTLQEAHVELWRARSGQQSALMAHTRELRDTNLRQMRESERAFADLVENSGKNLAGSPENNLRAAIEHHWDSFRSTNAQIAEELQSGEAGEAVSLPTRASLEAFRATERVLEEFVEYRKRENAREYRESLRSSQQARIWLCGLSIFGSLLGLGTGCFIASVMASPVKQIVVVLQDLEHGDLTRALGIDFGGEASAAVSSAVASGQRSVEQMPQTGSPMQPTSEKVAQILRVMDEIALQTNLLALNSAVHAAHAGEPGSGVGVPRSNPGAATSLSDSTKRVDVRLTEI